MAGCGTGGSGSARTVILLSGLEVWASRGRATVFAESAAAGAAFETVTAIGFERSEGVIALKFVVVTGCASSALAVVASAVLFPEKIRAPGGGGVAATIAGIVAGCRGFTSGIELGSSTGH